MTTPVARRCLLQGCLSENWQFTPYHGSVGRRIALLGGHPEREPPIQRAPPDLISITNEQRFVRKLKGMKKRACVFSVVGEIAWVW